MFSGFSDNFTPEEQCALIETALCENQKEREKFRVCYVELEEAIRDASYTNEYKAENLHMEIGKKPRLLHKKFDGPNIYSTIGAVVSEITDLPLTFQLKIDS